MKERYILAPGDVEFVGRLIETSVNLVGCIYGKIYFPTFSNGLKEVRTISWFRMDLVAGFGRCGAPAAAGLGTWRG